MRSIGMVACVVLVGAACCAPRPQATESQDTEAFDSAVVAAEIDSVMKQLTEHQLAGEFDDFNSYYTSLPEGTAAGDGSFFGSTAEFLRYMDPVFASVDSISSFEWVHYNVYPASDRSAVFAGQYREMVAMNGAAPTLVTGSFTVLFTKQDGMWEMTHVHSSHLR